MCRFHLPALTQLTELHFRTRELAKVMRFYNEVLGFPIVERTDSSAALSTTPEARLIIRFTLDPDAGERQPNETGLSRFGIRFPNLADVTRKLANLQVGYEVAENSISVVDPDGNAIELRDGLPGSDAILLENLHFTVKNIESARRFFNHYLGLEPASAAANALSFACGLDQRIEVTEVKDALLRKENEVGLVSYKINVHCGEVLYALNQRGAIFGFKTTSVPSSTVLQIKDPFGYLLEVEADEAIQRSPVEYCNELSLVTKYGWKANLPFLT